MKRRGFLCGAAGTAMGLLAGGMSRAPSEARVAVDHEHVGRAIAPDFVGLSYESAILAGGDYFTPANASVLGLIRLLGGNGVIRIGGNTSERTVWRTQAERAADGSFVITPASIDRLAACLRILGWKLIYGLNLARGTPEEAAAEAAYVTHAVGANLLAFQIGNEPDGFGRWAGARPESYDAPAFLAEWRRFHAAVRARVPDARFAGPDVAAETGWVAALAEAKPDGLVLLTRHYYADGPAGAPLISLAKLLRSDGHAAPVLDKLSDYAHAYHLPWRIAEVNSIYGEGQPGVSDTLGAALWGVEFMFQVATAGAAGINLHAGVHNLRPDRDKAYTPIARGTGGRHRATPLYYGMLMFAQAARGALVPVRLVSELDGLRTFAVRTPESVVRVCLINKDAMRTARATIDVGRRVVASSVMRLAGPAADATAGITLGGASIDDFGQWAGATEEIVPIANQLRVDVPAMSAALVSG